MMNLKNSYERGYVKIKAVSKKVSPTTKRLFRSSGFSFKDCGTYATSIFLLLFGLTIWLKFTYALLLTSGLFWLCTRSFAIQFTQRSFIQENSKRDLTLEEATMIQPLIDKVSKEMGKQINYVWIYNAEGRSAMMCVDHLFITEEALYLNERQLVPLIKKEIHDASTSSWRSKTMDLWLNKGVYIVWFPVIFILKVLGQVLSSQMFSMTKKRRGFF